MKTARFLALAGLALAVVSPAQAAEDSPPTREERLEWWREGRFGMFIHWGLYAIPAGTWGDKVYKSGYSEWIMFSSKIPAASWPVASIR
jgi:alpha-L-fucosidase